MRQPVFIIMMLLSATICGCAAKPSAPVFMLFVWGTSASEVMAVEGRPDFLSMQDDAERLTYDKPMYGLPFKVHYIFFAGKLDSIHYDVTDQKIAKADAKKLMYGLNADVLREMQPYRFALRDTDVEGWDYEEAQSPYRWLFANQILDDKGNHALLNMKMKTEDELRLIFLIFDHLWKDYEKDHPFDDGEYPFSDDIIKIFEERRQLDYFYTEEDLPEILNLCNLE